jgi:hypothetical protein
VSKKKTGAGFKACAGYYCVVIASEAKQSLSRHNGQMVCFVAYAPLRKRFALVAGNDEETSMPQ